MIITSAGGTVVTSSTPPAGTLVVSCEEDRREFTKLAAKGLLVLRADHVLTCVMRQELQTEEGQLS